MTINFFCAYPIVRAILRALRGLFLQFSSSFVWEFCMTTWWCEDVWRSRQRGALVALLILVADAQAVAVCAKIRIFICKNFVFQGYLRNFALQKTNNVKKGYSFGKQPLLAAGKNHCEAADKRVRALIFRVRTSRKPLIPWRADFSSSCSP